MIFSEVPFVLGLASGLLVLYVLATYWVRSRQQKVEAPDRVPQTGQSCAPVESTKALALNSAAVYAPIILDDDFFPITRPGLPLVDRADELVRFSDQFEREFSGKSHAADPDFQPTVIEFQDTAIS